MASEMILMADGQFECVMAYGAADDHATGRWLVEGESVVLDSKALGTPFGLLSSSSRRAPEVRVSIKGATVVPVLNIDVV